MQIEDTEGGRLVLGRAIGKNGHHTHRTLPASGLSEFEPRSACMASLVDVHPDQQGPETEDLVRRQSG